ncbi:MAG: AAA family ATPase [Phycisphaeraceae bacterium]|nr:AAA family ATPase [Phycisphaeraceae bacterium]
MRFHEIKIRNVRGIRSLDIEFNGQSGVIFGSNGTGKSTVVDAIDFLLTGDIRRLTGRRGASLREHGAHLLSDNQDRYVEATVAIPGRDGLVRISRSLAQPQILEYPADAELEVKRCVSAAAQRQYMLTRADILAFIAAVPKTRAEMVQAVLNLDSIEKIRQSLVRAANTSRSSFETSRAARVAAEGQLAGSLGLDGYGQEPVIDAVNRFRAALDGLAVERIDDAKRDLAPPQAAGERVSSPTPLADVELLGRSITLASRDSIDKIDESLGRHLAILRSNAADIEAAQRIEFLERAMLIVEGVQVCPVCDTTWPDGALSNMVQGKLDRGRSLLEPLEQVRISADGLIRWIGGHVEAVARLLAHPTDILPEPTRNLLLEYQLKILSLRDALSHVLSMAPLQEEASSRLSDRLNLAALHEALRELYRDLLERTKSDPRQTAWDALTRAEENWRTLKRCESTEAASKKLSEDADALRAAFIQARDGVLTDLYNAVRDRFVSFYKQVHAPDESGFTADIRPTDAGIELEVDFYGLTRAAPFALHSEGHQDSMGLCLFLALVERADAASLGFRVLDDVVMSVDIGHRNGVARLLTQLADQSQFIITTHDQVWTKQLQNAGCVTSRTCTRLLTWSVNTGPVARFDPDFLDDAYASLERHDVSNAAQDLRHGLEGFFQFAADSLRAKIPFSLAGRYDMGQVSSACISRLKELTKSAKNAANSWNQSARVAELSQIESAQAAALGQSNAEQWAINPNVHFNQDMNMADSEFRNVVDAFAGVRDLFCCPECRGLMAVIFEGATESAVKCPCGKTNWNLKAKPRENR